MPLPCARVSCTGLAASGMLALEKDGLPIPVKSPCQSFDPDRVTTFTAVPAFHPHSAELALV